MLSKSQAKIFFLGGTGVFSAAFLSLTFDTHRKVPAQTHADKITPAVTRGKHIWEDNNCMGCHTLFGEGAYYAPELTKVVERRGKPWMRLFLKDPEAMYPNERKMVNYHFKDDQIDDVIAFFEWCGNVDLNGFPAKPPLAVYKGADEKGRIVRRDVCRHFSRYGRYLFLELVVEFIFAHVGRRHNDMVYLKIRVGDVVVFIHLFEGIAYYLATHAR